MCGVPLPGHRPGRGTASGPGRRLLEEGGEQGRRAGGAVGVDWAVVDLASDLGGDRRGDVGWFRGLVVHAASGPVAVQPVAYVEVLLEVVTQREVQERPSAR